MDAINLPRKDEPAAQGCAWSRLGAGAPRAPPRQPSREGRAAPSHVQRPFATSFPAGRAARVWGEAGRDRAWLPSVLPRPPKRWRPSPWIWAGGRAAAVLCRGCCSRALGPARPRGSPSGPGWQRADAQVRNCDPQTPPGILRPRHGVDPSRPRNSTGSMSPAWLGALPASPGAHLLHPQARSPAGRDGGCHLFSSTGDRCRVDAG